MTVTVRSLEIAVPSTELSQEELRDVFLAQDDLSRLGSRLVSTSFDSSGIERRYSALDEWDPAPTDEEPLFFDRIGRASCREREKISVVVDSLTKENEGKG